MDEVRQIADQIDVDRIEELCHSLKNVRENGGRLFVLGVGGSAANASHMVNDVRKLCSIEAYCASDNVSELTARVNDEGWNTAYSGWLRTNRLCEKDAIFILSVGGGDAELNVSVSIINAIKVAKEQGAKVFGIVGREQGYTVKAGDCVVMVPCIQKLRVTPHAEEYQGIIWHCLVSNPILQVHSTKW